MSEIQFIGSDSFSASVKDAAKVYIVAPAAAIKSGDAFALLKASSSPLAVRPPAPHLLSCSPPLRYPRPASGCVTADPEVCPLRQAPMLAAAEALAAKAGGGSAAGSSSSTLVMGTDKEIVLVPLQDAPTSRAPNLPVQPLRLPPNRFPSAAAEYRWLCSRRLLLRDPVHGHHRWPLLRRHHRHRQGRHPHRPRRRVPPPAVRARPAS